MNFLKDVLIPQKIGNYHLIGERVIGIEINKQMIESCQLNYQGKTVNIENFSHQAIDSSVTVSYHERVVSALKNIFAPIDSYDAIKFSIPSNKAVIKQLTLPFTDMQKIGAILKFELEPFLPFALSQAVVDFIPLKIDNETGTTTILASAIPKAVLEEYLQYFTDAGLNPAVVTIDIFDLYGLYTMIPLYRETATTTILMNIGIHTTQLAYIDQGILTNTRTLQEGLGSWAKKLSASLHCSPQEALEKILRFGFAPNSDTAYTEALKDIIAPYSANLQFTLESFTHNKTSITTILLLGQASTLSNVSRFFQEEMGIPCSLIDAATLEQLPTFKMSPGKKLTPKNITSFATAYTSPTMNSFNLLKEMVSAGKNSLFTKQLITVVGLTTLFLGLLLFKTFNEIGQFKAEAKESEAQIIRLLKKEGLTTSRNMKTALNNAEEKVEEQEAIWFAFSKQSRVSLLNYLEQLSSAIDRVGLGLKLDKLIITQRDNDHFLVIQGNVKNFDSLKILERELRESNLFVYVPSFQTKSFNEEIPLKKNGEDS